MKTFIRYTAAALTLSFAAASHAAETPVSDEPTALLKAATSIEARQPVGEATEFKPGEKVYVWSQVKGAEGQEVEHVWKRDGKEIQRYKLDIGSANWRTSSRLQSVKPGSYTVDVMSGDRSLGSISFAVK